MNEGFVLDAELSLLSLLEREQLGRPGQPRGPGAGQAGCSQDGGMDASQGESGLRSQLCYWSQLWVSQEAGAGDLRPSSSLYLH